MGSRGAYIATKRMGEQLDAIEVNAVDTTAAGDAFNGAFAVGLLLGKTPVESARFAIAAAALSVTRAGAQPSRPSCPPACRDAHPRLGILRAGSHYQPVGSIWYFPQAYRNDEHGKLLLNGSSLRSLGGPSVSATW